MDDLGTDDVLFYVPPEVQEHVVVVLEPVLLLLASVLIPLMIATLTVLRYRQHRIEVHLVFGGVDAELFEAVVA